MRGFPLLLQAALGADTLVNPSRTGARMRAVRTGQLPVVLAARPDVAVVFVCAAVDCGLRAVGAKVLLVQPLDGAGFAVPHTVSLDCGGGREVTATHRAAWLVVRGCRCWARAAAISGR